MKTGQKHQDLYLACDRFTRSIIIDSSFEHVCKDGEFNINDDEENSALFFDVPYSKTTCINVLFKIRSDSNTREYESIIMDTAKRKIIQMSVDYYAELQKGVREQEEIAMELVSNFSNSMVDYTNSIDF